MTAIPRTDGDYQDIWRASELTVDAFTDWVRGSAFAQAVADEAAANGAVVDPLALAISADNEGVVGRVYLSWANADELAAITDAAIRVLETRSQDYFAQLGGEPAAVTVLHRAPITPAPPPLTDRFGALLKIGIGALAGIGLALLAYALDPVLRHRDEIERLGFKIVGSIPKR
jgi:capsular polysaccharide biosynthesis protein